MTFDPCEDCGSDLAVLRQLLFLGLWWLIPFIFAAVRRHHRLDAAHDRSLARVQWVFSIVASCLSLWWIKSPWF